MICSVWRIEFTPTTGLTSGVAVRLLDFGDEMETDIAFSPEQGIASSSPIFQSFGSHFALGGVQLGLTWSRRKSYSTPALARNAALGAMATFPWGQQGDITVAIDGGQTWKYSKSAVRTAPPIFIPWGAESLVLTTYSASLGAASLVP